MIIMNHIFGKADFLPTIKKNQGLLQRFTIEAPKTPRYLLGALEKIIHAREAELLPKAAKIIKSMYDLDILDEEVIIAWDDKVTPTKQSVGAFEHGGVDCGGYTVDLDRMCAKTFPILRVRCFIFFAVF